MPGYTPAPKGRRPPAPPPPPLPKIDQTDHATHTQLISYARWEAAEEYVITINGKPIGQTVIGRREACRIAEWLRTAIWDIRLTEVVT